MIAEKISDNSGYSPSSGVTISSKAIINNKGEVLQRQQLSTEMIDRQLGKGLQKIISQYCNYVALQYSTVYFRQKLWNEK